MFLREKTLDDVCACDFIKRTNEVMMKLALQSVVLSHASHTFLLTRSLCVR